MLPRLPQDLIPNNRPLVAKTKGQFSPPSLQLLRTQVTQKNDWMRQRLMSLEWNAVQLPLHDGGWL